MNNRQDNIEGKNYSVFSIVLLIALSITESVFAAGRDEFPRLDWAEGFILNAAEALNATQQGLIDHFKDVPPSIVSNITGGWHISKQQSFVKTVHIGLYINCRNCTQNGVPLIPLNITEFRYALAFTYRMPKDKLDAFRALCENGHHRSIL